MPTMYVQAVRNSYIMKPVSRLSTQTGTRTVSSKSLSGGRTLGRTGGGVGDADHVCAGSQKQLCHHHHHHHRSLYPGSQLRLASGLFQFSASLGVWGAQWG